MNLVDSGLHVFLEVFKFLFNFDINNPFSFAMAAFILGAFVLYAFIRVFRWKN